MHERSYMLLMPLHFNKLTKKHVAEIYKDPTYISAINNVFMR